MRVIIIPEDSYVSVDGEGYNDIDLSFMSTDIHALQWYGAEGELEIQNDRNQITENRKIDSLTPYQQAIDAWQLKKIASESLNETNQEK